MNVHTKCVEKLTIKNILFFLPNNFTTESDYLTQCARIRVPVVSMKIEKFKDLFRAALDRW